MILHPHEDAGTLCNLPVAPGGVYAGGGAMLPPIKRSWHRRLSDAPAAAGFHKTLANAMLPSRNQVELRPFQANDNMPRPA